MSRRTMALFLLCAGCSPAPVPAPTKARCTFTSERPEGFRDRVALAAVDDDAATIRVGYGVGIDGDVLRCASFPRRVVVELGEGFTMFESFDAAVAFADGGVEALPVEKLGRSEPVVREPPSGGAHWVVRVPFRGVVDTSRVPREARVTVGWVDAWRF